MQNPSGALIVLSGPSGVGKGLLRRLTFEEMPWLKQSVSTTTRLPRPGEVHGQDYFFVTPEEFQGLIEANQLVEWAEYAGYYYGTPRSYLEETMAHGHVLLLEIDIQGALNIRRQFSEAHLIFIAPPSMTVLEERLRYRNTNSEEEIQSRMAWAHQEMTQTGAFDVVIVNDQIELSRQSLKQVIEEFLSSRKIGLS